MSFAILSSTIGFIVILQAIIPFLLNKNNAFGVTIPEGHSENAAVQMYRKRYMFIMLSVGIILLIAFSAWNFTVGFSEEQIGTIGMVILFGLLAVNMIMYLIFHHKTKNLKKRENWGDGLKQLRIMDLSSRTKDEMLPSLLFSLPMLVTSLLIGYTVLHYDAMPDQVPYHWGPTGQPDAFTSKSPFTAIAVLLILLVIQGMLFSINIYIKQSGIKLSATKSKSSQIQQLASRKYTSRLLFFISILVTADLAFMQLTTIHNEWIAPSLLLVIQFIFIGMILLMTTVYALKVGQKGSRVKASIEDERTEGITDVDEDRFWKAGVIYVNRNDPSIFIEKRFGIGWTINFGQPLAYCILFIPLLLIITISFLL